MDETEPGACYNEIFIKDANTLFAKVTSIPINEYEATLPYYQIRDLKSGEKTADIQIFKRGITNKHKEYLPEVFLYSHDAMKPDGSRIAQAMGNVPQLNIIDTETGKVVAYRLSDGMSLSGLETAEELKPCFLRACADDKYIYTAFLGEGRLGYQGGSLCKPFIRFRLGWPSDKQDNHPTLHRRDCCGQSEQDFIHHVSYGREVVLYQNGRTGRCTVIGQ